MVQEFFAPIAAAKADSWEGTGLEGGGEAMSAVLDLIRQHKVSIQSFCQVFHKIAGSRNQHCM